MPHKQREQYATDEAAQGNVHRWRDILCGEFQKNLLSAPKRAQKNNTGEGRAV
jgi:hypothetical protein